MPTPADPAKTVLVAHERASVRERFRSALQGAGHRAVLVEDGAELLAYVRSDPAVADLLLIDLRLPGLPGVDLVRAVQDIDAVMPVLVFSGTVAGADEVRALHALGVSGYINESSAAAQIVPALAPHLFPDNFNRRGSPRVVLGIPIQYRFGQTIAAALTLNLGHGGVAIRTTSPLESGSRLAVTFRMPGGVREVEAEGRVVWSDRRVGMGVQFDAVDGVGQTMIDNFVDAHFFSGRQT